MNNFANENLFAQNEEKAMLANAPLAVRLRPQNIEEFVGQNHFIGQGKLLRRMIETGRLSSLIFYGPPGCGKTSLAKIISKTSGAVYKYLSAPAAGVADVRELSREARDRLYASNSRTLLFLDEIHRFNRAQQDVLLDDVENGIIILIGATTENPYFSVNTPLLSRSSVFEFQPLEAEDIKALLQRAINDEIRGLGKHSIECSEDAIDFLSDICDGDARKALNALEVGILSQLKNGKALFDLETAHESIQKKTIKYDRKGDNHYDLASALQKSMRGSDPDATVYWLARMIAGGEDARFIARRICVTAAEDVGNADPMATVLAGAAFQISDFVGFPEAQLHLAQAAIYIACAPKSNASAKAIWDAVSDVSSGKTIEVPLNLKDAHYKGAKKLGRGVEYKYPHDYPGNFVAQDYIGQELGKNYYKPCDSGREKIIGQYLQKLRDLLENTRGDK